MFHFSYFSQDDLVKLNSATKYPSIPTYHALGDKGRLTDELNVEFLPDEKVSITEKIDGTNTRIILPPFCGGNPIIGSREELLYYVGDLIRNPAQGIVETVLPLISSDESTGLYTNVLDAITVIYGEVYGGKTTANAKQYTGHRNTGFRVFDIAQIDPGILSRPVEEIASWRDHGGQQFVSADILNSIIASTATFFSVPEVRSGSLRDVPPYGVPATLAWLEATLSYSFASLDEDAGGRPEGVVVRTPDRSKIAKIRYEDYRRTVQYREKMERQRG